MKATIAIESRTSKPALRVDLRKAGRKLLTAACAVAMPMAGAVGIALMTARLQSEHKARKGGAL